MERSVTVVSNVYGGSPKDKASRELLKEQILSERLIDLSYAGDPMINKAIVADAWERLSLTNKRAFLKFAMEDLEKIEAEVAGFGADRDAQRSA